MSFSPPPLPSPSQGPDTNQNGGSNNNGGGGGNNNNNNGNNGPGANNGPPPPPPPVISNNTVPATDESVQVASGQWEPEDACSASDDTGNTGADAGTKTAQVTTEVGATIEHEFFGKLWPCTSVNLFFVI